jgi:hypothetical protein
MTWTIDTVPRHVGVSIKPMTVAPVPGRFAKQTGRLDRTAYEAASSDAGVEEAGEPT